MDFSSFSHILIGETHGFLDDERVIAQVLRSARPEVVLVEALQDLDVKSEEDLGWILSTSRFASKSMSRWLEIAVKDLKSRAHGIDLPNFGMDKRLQRIVNEVLKPTPEEAARLEDVVKEREDHQVRMMQRFHSERPIVVVVGAWHLRPGSPLRQATQGALLVIPKDERGTAVFGPQENKDKLTFAFEVNA